PPSTPTPRGPTAWTATWPSTRRRSRRWGTSRGPSPAPTPPPSGSARPASGPGSAVALRPEIRALLDQQAAPGRPPLHRQSVAQARAFHSDDAAALNGEPVPVAAVADRTVPGPGGGLPGRGHTPGGRAAFPIVVFFPRGGWGV